MDNYIIQRLLADRTTGKNIIWASGDTPQAEITVDDVSGIIPRCQKPKEIQKGRTKSKAEVYTPVWVVNKMVNSVDREWFGRPNAFNVPSKNDKSWTPTYRVDFGGKDWRDYVMSTRLEITCGEAPYLTTPYDTETGEPIDIKQRVGMYDRKLRVVSENCDTPLKWYDWAVKATEATFGYEFQGDSLWLARCNLLYAFTHAYQVKWGVMPSPEKIDHIAGILSWNIWQMDGLKDCVPLTDTPALILDRQAHRVVEFRSLKGASKE